MTFVNWWNDIGSKKEYEVAPHTLLQMAWVAGHQTALQKSGAPAVQTGNIAMLEIASAMRDLCDFATLGNWSKLGVIKERMIAVIAQLQQ